MITFSEKAAATLAGSARMAPSSLPDWPSLSELTQNVLANFGKATGIGMLALSTMQSVILKQEVLCTEFNQAESASMFFVVPPSEEEPKDAMQEAVA